MPKRQPKRGRLWLAEGSCVRPWPERANEIWAYESVHDRTHDGRAYRILTVIDGDTRACLARLVGRRPSSDGVLATLTDLFAERDPADHIRSDQGAEFTATAVCKWLGRLSVAAAYIERASPWENGYNESFT